MNVKERLKKERVVVPLMMKGYSRSMASSWYGKMQYDMKVNKNEFGSDALNYWHKKGYLGSSIKRYNLIDNPKTDYITDFEYLYLTPFNNSFGKWLEDMLTTQRVLKSGEAHFRQIYFSIIQREKQQLILRVGHEDRRYSTDDVLDLLREKGALELRPAFWNSDRKRHLLTFEIDEQTGEELFYSNGIKASAEWIEKTINRLYASYVIADPVSIGFDFGGKTLDHSLKFWIANDTGLLSQILCAEITIYWTDPENNKRLSTPVLVDLKTGSFE